MGKYPRLFDPTDPSGFDPDLAEKFIRCLMGRGRLATARRVFNDTLERVHRRVRNADPFEVFAAVVEHLKPDFEMRSRLIGVTRCVVPIGVRGARQESLAIRRLIAAARGKTGRPIHLGLAEEIVAAYR